MLERIWYYENNKNTKISHTASKNLKNVINRQYFDTDLKKILGMIFLKEIQ